MFQQQLSLDTFQYILSQCSDDIIRDCSKIIVKLLEPPSDSRLNESNNFLDKKAFAAVSALLKLYKKHRSSNINVSSELPLPLIIKSISYMLNCSNGNCNLPENDVQHDVLSVVSSVFCNELSQNSSKYLQKLAEFYDYLLTCIDANKTNTECKSECWIFKLKILSLIYEVLTNILSPCVTNLHEELKLKKDSKEGELFAYMILHDDKSIAIQTLMDLIPKYINCFESGKIVEIIWYQISNCMFHSDIRYSRIYTILCNFFSHFFDKSLFRDKVNLALLLPGDANYWKLVQSALTDKDPIKRKQGLYLFKKTIELLYNTSTDIVFTKEKNVFYWHFDCTEELYKIYSDVIIILEFLEEQQVHIIKPIFNMAETLVENIFICSKIDFSWILLVYQRALMHENSQVIKWGLSNLLKLPSNFYSHEYIVKETAKLLVITLNNVNLYYSDGLIISNELKTFFKKVTQLITARTFFSIFIKEICSQIWSAEALFFVTHSLSGIGKFSFWREEEIFEIKKFVSKAFKTHNKIIRNRVQHELLTTILSLTDKNYVSLENIILLLSEFPTIIVLKIETVNWKTLDWLNQSYTEKDVKNVLDKYKKKELGKEFNEKCISLMLILFFYCYFDFETEDNRSFIMNYLLDIFLSYKGICKRPYCNNSLHDHYLTIISFIYEANVSNSIEAFLKPTFPFVSDVILYIQTRLRQISSLHEFTAFQLYSKTFENIIKTLVLFKIDSKNVKDFYEEISKWLELTLHSNSAVSSVGLYYRIKFLGIILTLYPSDLGSEFLLSYLLEKVNEPLKKNDEYSEKTRDLQTLWGKMNSEFLEEKWKILEYLIKKGQPVKAGMSALIRSHDLSLLCVEALNTGSYGVLCPVMSILKNLLPVLENDLETRKIIDSVWKLILERRKTEQFKLFLKHFIEMLFQKCLILKGEFMQEILLKYSDIIFSDSSLAVVNIFMKHIQQMNIVNCSVFLFCYIIGKGLIFGPVQKKDERLTNRVCSHIMSLKICNFEGISDSLSSEIRARAIQIILTLNKYSPSHQTAASDLITVLLKMENEISKNRIRYYSDSHVHRVKHRLLQALLLLEPLLSPNENQVEELSNWVHSCLMKEDSQPSVRYLQEWLLVRILLRNPELCCRFSIDNSCNQFKEIKKKSLCSLFAITFHLCKLIPFDSMEEKIFHEISSILPFCFHQHFEVRLHAQAVLLNLYEFAEKKNLIKIIKEYRTIRDGLINCFSKDMKGNFSINLVKLNKNFYFSTFNPLEHYSLETIFVDLPKLANVGSDEWISIKTFKFCGVDSDKVDIPLINGQSSLDDSSWINFNKLDGGVLVDFEDQKSAEILGNYQKKMIPVKPLIPDWDEGCEGQNSLKKDGLIVVASLIDRIPNLGGLARTCEVFGASEYIINSLKYAEDKQFTTLSVTAEKWITIKEVKIHNLMDYIFEMKQKGYNVIGAEQALYSQPLGSVKFPRKSLLLLGNEKEGIPSNLLPLLDICVEIPQLGIIRSLNVHVTGALFIWEYAKQNHFS